MGDIEFDREFFELTIRDIDALEHPSSSAPDARFAFLMYIEDLRDRVAAYRVAATLMGDAGLLAQIETAEESLERAAAIPEPPPPPPQRPPAPPQTPDPPRRPWTPIRPVTPLSAPSVPPSPSERRRPPSVQRGRRVRLDVYDTGSQSSLASVSVASRAPSVAASVASASSAATYLPRRRRGRSSSRSSDVSTTAVAYFPMRDEPDQLPRPLIQCAACLEDIDAGDVVTPCSHHYHRGCMAGLFEAAVSDEWLFPPKCCGQPIDLDTVLDALPTDIRRRSLSRLDEIQDLLRVHCACGALLGMQHDLPPFVTCPECAAVVCAACRSAHPPDLTCAQHEDALPIVGLAVQHLWRRCPGCRSYVERTEGCPHMTCRCSTQFCYHCGSAPWKSCPC